MGCAGEVTWGISVLRLESKDMDWHGAEGILMAWLEILRRTPGCLPPETEEYCPSALASRCDGWLRARLRDLDFGAVPPKDLGPWVTVRFLMATQLVKILEQDGQAPDSRPPRELLDHLLMAEWYHALHLRWAEWVRDSREQSRAE